MSATTDRLFKTLLREMRAFFKAKGFRTNGQNFILESAECWVIINFQRSRWANEGEITFYVNVAASSKRWLGVAGKPASELPRYYECDWQWRVEQFGIDKNASQWTIRDEESLRHAIAYLQNLVRESVFPAIETMTTEAGLLKQTGGFEFPQLKTRTVILASTNQIEDLKQAVVKLISKFSNSVAAADRTLAHLELLRKMYPDAMHRIESEIDASDLKRRPPSSKLL